jgi:hypothetical protein
MLSSPDDEVRSESLSPNTEAVERALNSLVPQPLQVDREQLMFLAGLAAAHPTDDESLFAPVNGLRFWQTWAAVSSTLATGLALWLLVFHSATWSPDPNLAVRTAPVATTIPEAIATDHSSVSSDFGYIRDRDLALSESWPSLANSQMTTIASISERAEHPTLNWRQWQAAELR